MHTPTPYAANVADTRELEPGKYIREVLISGPHFTPDEMGTAAVDAAFIRKACNMHEELVEALSTLVEQADYLAGRGFVGALRREQAERNVLEQVQRARALLAKTNE